MDYFTHIDRAHSLIDLGRYDEALKVLEDVPLTGNFTYFTFPIRINCHLQLEQKDEAAKLLKIAIAKYPNNATLHQLYANYYSMIGNRKSAIQHISTAISLEPENVGIICYAAKLEIQFHNIRKAKSHLAVAEEIEPSHIMIYILKSVIHMHNGEYKLALKFVKAGLEIEPNNPDLMSLMTNIKLEDSSLLDEAENEAYQTLAMDPTNSFARNNLLEILKRKNIFVRFFTKNAFSRYKIQWTFWRVVFMIVLWKGFLIWSGFALLYLLITWYGGVFFNSCIRLHKKYSLLLSEEDILQSNIFIIYNLIIACAINFRNFMSDEAFVGGICILFSALLVSISYFEISTKPGKTQFFIFSIICGFLIILAIKTPLLAGFLSILFLLIYAFLYSLRILFK